jgi:hypothetical protein
MSGGFLVRARYNFTMRDSFTVLTFKAATIALLTLTFSGATSFAEKLVEPDKVAPEFREAAEKRRAEQMRIIDCNNAAKMANVLPRDSMKFMADCIDKGGGRPSDISSSTKK